MAKKEKTYQFEIVTVNNLVVQFLTRHYSLDVTKDNYTKLQRPDQKVAKVEIDPDDPLYLKVTELLTSTDAKPIMLEIYTALMWIQDELYPELIHLLRKNKNEIKNILQQQELLKALMEDKITINRITLAKRDYNSSSVKLLKHLVKFAIMQSKQVYEQQQKAYIKLLYENSFLTSGEITINDKHYNVPEQPLPPHLVTFNGTNGNTYLIDLTEPLTLLPLLNENEMRYHLIRSVQWRLRALLRYKYESKDKKIKLITKGRKYSSKGNPYDKVKDAKLYPLIIALSKLVFGNDYRGEKSHNCLKKINEFYTHKANNFLEWVPKDIIALFP